jgi:uncharacterized membrane protein
MVFARFLIIFLVLAIAVCIAAFVVTGNQQYRDWAWRLGKFGVAAGVIFFGVLIAERI